MDPTRLHAALLEPKTYPGASSEVTYCETHVSRLYFVDAYVYKVKKPVNFGFLDFSTLARRRFYCQEEVRLNRRFAPDTYLRVAAIRRSGSNIAIDGPGRTVEHAVVMRRLPEERMLDKLVQRNDPLLPKEIVRLGYRLAELHRESPVCRRSAGGGYAAVVARNWQENFAQIEPLVGPTINSPGVEHCRNWIDAFLARHRSLLREREALGMVRDGHGDLHAEHVCLTDPLCIYDCIEFSRRFRVGDLLADLAFLLMDLDFRGRRDLARQLLQVWCEQLPEQLTPENLSLLRFYMVYRAFVRGKVDTFLAVDRQASTETRQAAAGLALRYFNLALGYLVRPGLILTCGLMGVGKSTLAQALAHALGAELLRSDVVRKELAGLRPATSITDPYGSGLYSDTWSERTYAALLHQAQDAWASGNSVIVDAAFGRQKDRRMFLHAAAAAGAPAQLLHLQCNPATALARLDRRNANRQDPSDGRRGLYPRQAAVFDPPADDEQAFIVDSSISVELNVQSVLCQLLYRHGTVSP